MLACHSTLPGVWIGNHSVDWASKTSLATWCPAWTGTFRMIWEPVKLGPDLPMAVAPVTRMLEAQGADVVIRMGKAKDGPVVTDQGLWLLDATFPNAIADPATLDRALLMTPGVLDHGLFLGMATDVIVGHPSGDVEHLQK